MQGADWQKHSHDVIMHTVVQESVEGRKGKCNGEA